MSKRSWKTSKGASFLFAGLFLCILLSGGVWADSVFADPSITAEAPQDLGAWYFVQTGTSYYVRVRLNNPSGWPICPPMKVVWRVHLDNGSTIRNESFIFPIWLPIPPVCLWPQTIDFIFTPETNWLNSYYGYKGGNLWHGIMSIEASLHWWIGGGDVGAPHVIWQHMSMARSGHASAQTEITCTLPTHPGGGQYMIFGDGGLWGWQKFQAVVHDPDGPVNGSHFVQWLLNGVQIKIDRVIEPQGSVSLARVGRLNELNLLGNYPGIPFSSVSIPQGALLQSRLIDIWGIVRDTRSWFVFSHPNQAVQIASTHYPQYTIGQIPHSQPYTFTIPVMDPNTCDPYNGGVGVDMGDFVNADWQIIELPNGPQVASGNTAVDFEGITTDCGNVRCGNGYFQNAQVVWTPSVRDHAGKSYRVHWQVWDTGLGTPITFSNGYFSVQDPPPPPQFVSYNPAAQTVNMDAGDSVPFWVTIRDDDSSQVTVTFTRTIDNYSESRTISINPSTHIGDNSGNPFTYTFNPAHRGSWQVTVTADDGIGPIQTGRPWNLTLQNSNPTIGNPSTAPPLTGGFILGDSRYPINFSADINDADNDNISYTWTVTRNNGQTVVLNPTNGSVSGPGVHAINLPVTLPLNQIHFDEVEQDITVKLTINDPYPGSQATTTWAFHVNNIEPVVEQFTSNPIIAQTPGQTLWPGRDTITFTIEGNDVDQTNPIAAALLENDVVYGAEAALTIPNPPAINIVYTPDPPGMPSRVGEEVEFKARLRDNFDTIFSSSVFSIKIDNNAPEATATAGPDTNNDGIAGPFGWLGNAADGNGDGIPDDVPPGYDAILTLDATGSADYDGDNLTYQWTMVPDLSASLRIENPTAPVTRVFVDQPLSSWQMVRFDVTVTDDPTVSDPEILPKSDIASVNAIFASGSLAYLRVRDLDGNTITRVRCCTDFYYELWDPDQDTSENIDFIPITPGDFLISSLDPDQSPLDIVNTITLYETNMATGAPATHSNYFTSLNNGIAAVPVPLTIEISDPVPGDNTLQIGPTPGGVGDFIIEAEYNDPTDPDGVDLNGDGLPESDIVRVRHPTSFRVVSNREDIDESQNPARPHVGSLRWAVEGAGSNTTICFDTSVFSSTNTDPFAVQSIFLESWWPEYPDPSISIHEPSPGTPDHVAVDFAPRKGGSGITLTPIVVEIRDELDAPVTFFNGDVTVAISSQPSGTYSLSGTLTKPLVNGAATFSDLVINLEFPGQWVDLAFTSTGGLAGATTRIDVVDNPQPGVPDHLQIVEISKWTNSGQVMDPIVVHVRDNVGSLVNWPGTVRIDECCGTNGGLGPTLSGETIKNVTNGTVTFDNITVTFDSDDTAGFFTAYAESGPCCVQSSGSSIEVKRGPMPQALSKIGMIIDGMCNVVSAPTQTPPLVHNIRVESGYPNAFVFDGAQQVEINGIEVRNWPGGAVRITDSQNIVVGGHDPRQGMVFDVPANIAEAMAAVSVYASENILIENNRFGFMDEYGQSAAHNLGLLLKGAPYGVEPADITETYPFSATVRGNLFIEKDAIRISGTRHADITIEENIMELRSNSNRGIVFFDHYSSTLRILNNDILHESNSAIIINSALRPGIGGDPSSCQDAFFTDQLPSGLCVIQGNKVRPNTETSETPSRGIWVMNYPHQLTIGGPPLGNGEPNPAIANDIYGHVPVSNNGDGEGIHFGPVGSNSIQFVRADVIGNLIHDNRIGVRLAGAQPVPRQLQAGPPSTQLAVMVEKNKFTGNSGMAIFGHDGYYGGRGVNRLYGNVWRQNKFGDDAQGLTANNGYPMIEIDQVGSPQDFPLSGNMQIQPPSLGASNGSTISGSGAMPNATIEVYSTAGGESTYDANGQPLTSGIRANFQYEMTVQTDGSGNFSIPVSGFSNPSQRPLAVAMQTGVTVNTSVVYGSICDLDGGGVPPRYLPGPPGGGGEEGGGGTGEKSSIYTSIYIDEIDCDPQSPNYDPYFCPCCCPDCEVEVSTQIFNSSRFSRSVAIVPSAPIVVNLQPGATPLDKFKNALQDVPIGGQITFSAPMTISIPSLSPDSLYPDLKKSGVTIDATPHVVTINGDSDGDGFADASYGLTFSGMEQTAKGITFKNFWLSYARMMGSGVRFNGNRFEASPNSPPNYAMLHLIGNYGEVLNGNQFLNNASGHGVRIIPNEIVGGTNGWLTPAGSRHVVEGNTFNSQLRAIYMSGTARRNFIRSNDIQDTQDFEFSIEQNGNSSLANDWGTNSLYNDNGKIRVCGVAERACIGWPDQQVPQLIINPNFTAEELAGMEILHIDFYWTNITPVAGDCNQSGYSNGNCFSTFDADRNEARNHIMRYKIRYPDTVPGNPNAFAWNVPTTALNKYITAVMTTLSGGANSSHLLSNGVLVTGTDGNDPPVCSVQITPQLPTCDASGDPCVNPGIVVTMDATGSTDPDGDQITEFHWQQTAGPSVNVNGSINSIVSFTAPPITGQVTLEFQLVVVDQYGLPSSPCTIQIIVTDADLPPIVFAGDDITLNENEIGTFNGYVIDIPAAQNISWALIDNGGTTYTIDDFQLSVPSGVDAPISSFTAPDVAVSIPFIFELRVDDGVLVSDQVSVTVTDLDGDEPPTVVAAPDQLDPGVDELQTFTFNQSAITDDSVGVTHTWTLAAQNPPTNPPFAIEDFNIVNNLDPALTTFTAPEIVSGAYVDFQFRLTADDQINPPVSATVWVKVKNLNVPTIVIAEPNQNVNEGSTFSFNSSSVTGTLPANISWSLTGQNPLAPDYTLADFLPIDYTDPLTTFAAPEVPQGGVVFTFTLTADDGTVPVPSDTVTVTVNDTNGGFPGDYGHKIYVPNLDDHTVSIIDDRTQTTIAKLGSGVGNPFNAPSGVALTPNALWAYVVNGASLSFSMINTLTDTVEFSQTLQNPSIVFTEVHSVAISPDGRFVLIGAKGDTGGIVGVAGIISVFDREQDHLQSDIRLIPVAGDVPAVPKRLAFSDVNPMQFYVANYTAGAKTYRVTIDPVAVDWVQIGGFQTDVDFAMVQGEERAVVTSEADDRLYIVDFEANTFTFISLPAGGYDPRSVTVSPDGKYAYVLHHQTCVPADLDGDGIPCEQEDFDRFIAILLGSPPTPEELCAGDFNGDGVIDGGDIQGYTDLCS